MVCRNFILPEICKPCLFLSTFQFAKFILPYPCTQAEAVFEQQALGYRLQLAPAFGAAGEEGFLLFAQGAEEFFLVAAEQMEGGFIFRAGGTIILRRLDIAVPELLQDTRVFHFLHLVFSKNVRHTEVPNGVVMV